MVKQLRVPPHRPPFAATIGERRRPSLASRWPKELRPNETEDRMNTKRSYRKQLHVPPHRPPPKAGWGALLNPVNIISISSYSTNNILGSCLPNPQHDHHMCFEDRKVLREYFLNSKRVIWITTFYSKRLYDRLF